MVKLGKDGPQKFIEYACNLTTIHKNNFFQPIRAPHLSCHKTISLQDFILCVEKYTKNRWNHPVRLDAEIVEPDIASFHRIVFTGIRDPGLWDGKSAKFFPGGQEGIWHCTLEEVLEFGFSPEKVSVFRGVFNIIKKYGHDDDIFFDRSKLVL